MKSLAAYKPLDDPDTGETYQISKPDYLAGLNKLLKALESINGQTTLDKRGELRTEFYLELHRRAGERVSEFCTRFRSLVADLRAEGVALPEGELGWFLKEKLGLDGLRKQLLETALQGREAYDVIEAETLRLFKDLHVSDPMHRRFDRPKLTVRRMFGGPSNASTAPSSAWSSAASTRTASSMASSRPNLGPRRFPAARQVNFTEVPDEPEVEAQRWLSTPRLRRRWWLRRRSLPRSWSWPRTRALIPSFWSLESNLENAAEALVTMKEARTKLADVRKDRGYGKASGDAGAKKFVPGAAASRKASGKHPCFDCGKTGHWAGDAECPSPGAV